MSYRKGYFSEHKAKQELVNVWGAPSVIKVAIGGAQDYIIACSGELIKVIEVKEIHITKKKKRYYPTPREKRQIQRIIEFAKDQFISAELWIFRYYGRGKPTIKETIILYEPCSLKGIF